MFADNVVVYVNPVWPLTAVSDVHVGDVPEYHRYKYGAVPPDGGVTVSVVDWPLTTTLFDAVGAADAVSESDGLLSVTCAVGEYTVFGMDSLSMSL